MHQPPYLKKTLLSLVIGSLGLPMTTTAADFLTFAQYPAGASSREPAPNVIISADDSISMGTDGIKALKDALNASFSATNIPDDRIRLSWQQMSGCNNNAPDVECPPTTMASFSGSRRTAFTSWVSGLSDISHTPSHSMVFNAGKYLMKTGAASPWNKIPGTADAAPLACRKAFHIFMTDGIWTGPASNTLKDGSRGKTINYGYLKDKGQITANIDNTTVILPDGKNYDASSNQTRAYRDNWGFNTYTSGRNTVLGINTLADLSFHYWATDLQPDIPNKVNPTIKKSGPETFSNGNKSVDLEQYWNPKNDPANWQHMVTYTIGFKDAATLTRPTGDTAPLFDKSGGIDQATYAGEFNQLVTGEKFWPRPFSGTDGTVHLDSTLNPPSAGDQTTVARGRMYDLWHMAINGRGKFFPATNSSELAEAFKKVLDTIVADTSQPMANFASASSSISNQGTTAYVSSFEADGWKGGISSKTVAANTGTLSNNSAWGITTVAPIRGKTTGDIMDALTETNIDNRLIISYNEKTLAGVPFAWANMSTDAQTTSPSVSQQKLLNTLNGTVDTKGSDRLNFIRGKRTLEVGQTGGTFRQRKSRQGDVVNSAIWYIGRPISTYTFDAYRTFANNHSQRMPMLYVGGNDGMLHGFSAADGTEKIAYVPRGVIKNLPLLTDPSYTHRYYVDGSPFTGDVNVGNTATPDWRTMLVGTLGAGGKGYFVLDVTKPGYTGGAQTSNFTAANAANLVVMDKTDGGDADIGHVFGDPVTSEFNKQIATQIVKMNNGRWAVVFGNGYNSTNEQPVLLIQYLDGDKSLKKISAATTGTEATQNGLSTPRLVDLNGDGTPDVVYAGDLRGNLWKFNISSETPSEWGVAFSESPLYTAVYKNNTSARQPITAAPNVRPNTSVGGMMVAFGTGKNVTEGDRTDTTKQTFYSILDNTRYKVSSGKVVLDTSVTPAAIGANGREVAGTGPLVERTFNETANTGTGTSTGATFWRMDDSQPALSYVGANAKKGWYFELPATGERVLSMPEFFSGSDVIDILSVVPASGGNVAGETCEPTSTPAKGFRTLLGVEYGKRPTHQLLDVNGDGIYNSLAAQDNSTNRTTAAPEGLKLSARGKQIRIGGDNAEILNDLPKPPSTLNWRQLQ